MTTFGSNTGELDMESPRRRENNGEDPAAPAATLLSERLTFPQIWVESVCESSDEEEVGGCEKRAKGSPRSPSSPSSLAASNCRHLTGTRPKDKVIRSLLTSCTSSDVSFESNSSSSRQNSFQLSSRENSEELEWYCCYQPPAIDQSPSSALDEGGQWQCGSDSRGLPTTANEVGRGHQKHEEKGQEEEEEEAATDGSPCSSARSFPFLGVDAAASSRGREDTRRKGRKKVGLQQKENQTREVGGSSSSSSSSNNNSSSGGGGNADRDGETRRPFESMEGAQATGKEVQGEETEGPGESPSAPPFPHSSSQGGGGEDFHTPVALMIEKWLEKIQSRGFGEHVVRSFAKEEINYDDEDDTWFDRDLVRVFDPYYDVDRADVQEVAEGRADATTGMPIGECTVRLKSGDELFGYFRKGLRQGRGSIEGANLLRHGLVCVRGAYRDGVLVGPGTAILAEGSMWGSVGRVTLEGVFNDGYLEGPVRGVDDSGVLVFVGQYQHGLPVGTCWLAREGQGWLCGRVDGRGRFSGEEITFLYPDRSTAMVGRFREEVMLQALAGRVAAADLNEAHILCLAMTSSSSSSSSSSSQGDEMLPTYSFSPSNAAGIHCDWSLPDCYEAVTVECRRSSVHEAGEGLFALRELPEGRVVSFYNGVRVRPGEAYSPDNLDYQIYVDWSNTDNSPFMDVPRACTDVSRYCATLGHKANHSFRPNCCYVVVDHPRFGRIPALKTLQAVERDEELFAHYKYDMALAPVWYQVAWEKIKDEQEREKEE